MASIESAQSIGLDTSVVLRLLTGEPEPLAKVALAAMQTAMLHGKSILVSDLVVAESYFALHTYYEVPKPEAMQQLLAFLKHDHVRAGGAAIHALEAALGSSNRLGFVDRLIHSSYASTSAAMLTFEKAARRLEGAIWLKTGSIS